jgi:hypothetical protein
VKRANARGFAMDIKLIAKPLIVKTQAKLNFLELRKAEVELPRI